jgi:hypothetical protein
MRAGLWLGLLVRKPWLAPAAFALAADSALRRWANPRERVPSSPDPELSLGHPRFNHVQGLLRQGQVKAALASMSELIDQTLPDDTYTCAQRLSNAFYVARLSATPFPQNLVNQLHRDAARVAQFPEFRRNNSWFNNHLLNDLRGLALYWVTWDALAGNSIARAMDRIERILMQNLDTLFRDGEGPMLNEGSVSYEILVLARIFDIALAVPERPIGRLFAGWLTQRAYSQVSVYLLEPDRVWLLPAVGDVTPDWSWEDATSFLDGVFLGRDTMYRRVWGSALEAMGFPAARHTHDPL